MDLFVNVHGCHSATPVKTCILSADMQKHPSSLAVLAEDLRKLAEIHKS